MRIGNGPAPAWNSWCLRESPITPYKGGCSMRFIWKLCAIVVLCLPSLILAEAPPTEKDLEIEIFKHFEYPCSVVHMIKSIKETDFDPPNDTRENMVALAVVTHKIALTDSDMRMGSYKDLRERTGIDLKEKTRQQRMAIYQYMLGACIGGAISAKSNTVDAITTGPYVSEIGAIGWEFDPIPTKTQAGASDSKPLPPIVVSGSGTAVRRIALSEGLYSVDISITNNWDGTIPDNFTLQKSNQSAAPVSKA